MPVNWEAPFGQSLWEHQGHPLTVRELRLRLAEASDQDAPVYVGIYDGSSVAMRLPLDLSAETNGTDWRVVLTVGESVLDSD